MNVAKVNLITRILFVSPQSFEVGSGMDNTRIAVTLVVSLTIEAIAIVFSYFG